MAIKSLVVGALFVALPLGAAGQTTEPSGDAAEVYLQAARLIRDDDARNIMSPASSNAVFPREYPPLPDEWVQMERQDYHLHAEVRELAHEAGLMQRANWPVFKRLGPNNFSYLNEMRNLANELGDAAKYQSLVLNQQPAAFGTAGDLLRLESMLKDQPGEILVRLLVGEGIDALAQSRLMVMIANAKITDDPSDAHDLPLATATQWIGRLLDHPDAEAELQQSLKNEPAGAQNDPIMKPSLVRILQTIHRAQTERDLAAMSLAAHVYEFKQGRWPANLAELATELPRVPVDAFGDGKQTLGYVLIAGGLPDGSDRPLVYSHERMKDGLFFRTDEPQYDYYSSDGSNLPVTRQKHGGQFRDVAGWSPQGTRAGVATTQPVP